MAVIDYTRRKERLGNIGAVRRVDTPDVSALESNVSVARSRERLAEAGARLGKDIADAGERIGRGAISLAADLKAREEDRILAKAAGMIIQRNEHDLLSTERDDAGLVAGFLNRTGEDCLNLTALGQTRLRETLEAVGGALELTDGQMESLKLKMSPYARSCESRLMSRETEETLRVQVAEAEALWKNEVRAIADGNNSDEMFAATIADFDHYLDVSGVSGESRKRQHDTFVLSLVKNEVEGAVGRFASEKEFDEAIAEAERDPKSLLMGNQVLERETGGKVGEALAEELVRKMKDARERFVDRTRHERMLEAERIKGDFVRRELDLVGKDLSPTAIADFYRSCGANAELKAASPETALRYREAADRLERAIRKGECEETEDSLSLRMTDLMMREARGDAELHGGRIAAEQAAIWRDYQAALRAGKLSEGFASRFLSRIANRLTDQECAAMREFYSSFGWHGELNREGEPSAKDRKEWAKERVLAPVDESEPMTGDVAKGRKLTGAQMFELGDMFLRQLRTMGPEAYRPEAMRKMIGEIKARRMADDFGRNRDMLAWKILNIQRNLKAGERRDDGNDRDGWNRDGSGSGGAEGGRQDD